MFGILSGLRKVRIRVFQHRVLIAVSKLLLQSNIAWDLVIFSFGGAFRGVLIRYVMRHDFHLLL